MLTTLHSVGEETSPGYMGRMGGGDAALREEGGGDTP